MKGRLFQMDHYDKSELHLFKGEGATRMRNKKK